MTVIVKMDAVMKRKLAEAAAKDHRTVSSFVRHAVARQIEALEGGA